jgi:hypothetical protein
MPVRLVSLLLVLLSVPAFLPTDAATARMQVVRHDAEELSALSVSLQSDLQQLQAGLLAKDLHENLKKIEKLSKKLRRDMQP